MNPNHVSIFPSASLLQLAHSLTVIVQKLHLIPVAVTLISFRIFFAALSSSAGVIPADASRLTSYSSFVRLLEADVAEAGIVSDIKLPTPEDLGADVAEGRTVLSFTPPSPEDFL